MNDFVRVYNDEDRVLKVVNFNEVFKLVIREVYKEYIIKMV